MPHDPGGGRSNSNRRRYSNGNGNSIAVSISDTSQHPPASSSSSSSSPLLSCQLAAKIFLVTLAFVLVVAIILNLQFVFSADTFQDSGRGTMSSENFVQDSSSESVDLIRIYIAGSMKYNGKAREILKRIAYLKEHHKCPILSKCRFSRYTRHERRAPDDTVLMVGPDRLRDYDGVGNLGRLLYNPQVLNRAGPSDRFNFTISYHPNSTIALNSFQYKTVLPRVRKRSRSFENKSRIAATLLNRCQSQSLREDYIDGMQDQVSVHIYGDCGAPCPGDTIEECLAYLSRYYKFFLVFEEYLCQFYQSSRLWQVLENSDMVPVVFGGVDYSLVLPEYSFIDALGQSPHTLAHYLRYLDQNGAEYGQYLDWRGTLRVVHTEWPCELCSKLLFQIDLNEEENPSYLNENTKCTSWPKLDFDH